MNAKFLLPLAAVSMLALAACSNPETPAEPAASTETSAPAATAPAATPAAPAATPAAPAADAMAPAAAGAAVTPEQAMQAVQAQAANMTPEQKTETIAAARKAAEDAGKAQGLSDDQIKQAGDLAEQAAKQMLGVQ